jgi:hypothetical protein
MNFLGELVEFSKVALLETTHLLSHTLVIVDELVHWYQGSVVRTKLRVGWRFF